MFACVTHSISLLQAHVLSTDTHSVKISSDESAVANPPTLVPANLVKIEPTVANPTPVPTIDLSKIPDTLGENMKDHCLRKHCIFADIKKHLADLIVSLKDTEHIWNRLGLQLGLEYFALKAIEKESRGVVQECMIDMLAAWLNGQGKECTRQTLKTALLNIGCKIVSVCFIYVMQVVSFFSLLDRE